MREWIGEMNSKGISVKDQIKEYELIIMLMEVKINFLKNIKEELIEKTGTSDHLVPVKRDHHISLIIIHLRSSIYFGLGWSI